MTHKSRARMWQQIIILGLLLQTLSISAAVHTENCPDNISGTLTHEYILRGASLAELSYKTPGQYHRDILYQCPQGGAQSYAVFRQPVILRDIEHDLYSHAKACVEGTYEDDRRNGCVERVDRDSEREIGKTVLGRRIGGRRLRETHYRCTDSDTDLSNLTMTIQWVNAHDELSLLIRLGVLRLSKIEYTEDLRLVQLDSGDWKEERWTGTAGTGPPYSESFLTTVRALQGRSCLFDFALEIAASFFREKCEGHPQPTNFRGFIVGHSLGGMASEYIAMKGGVSSAMERCEADDTSVRVLSYNSIGWDSSVDGDVLGNRAFPGIYSIRINGEILEIYFPNRRYLGHLVRYNSPEEDCGPLCRHKINTVQRAIRICQSCGGVEFSYRNLGAPQ